MIRKVGILRLLALTVLFGSVAVAGPIGSIFFNSNGNPTDVQLILNGTTTINKSNTGWYSDLPSNNQPGGANYVTGFCSNCGGPIFRSFFTFNIPAELIITTASLNINTYIYDSSNPTETLSLFDVSTALASILAGTGGIGAYNDFGTGVLYGSRVYTLADQNLFRTISLNASAVSAIQQQQGGTFVLGGSLDAVAVPEPSSLALVAGVLGFLALRHATRRTRRP
jgi:hypothetical protein